MSAPRHDSDRDLDRAVLNALFAGSPVGLHVLDTDLRVVRMSTSAQGNPRFPDKVTRQGRQLWELAPGLDASQIEHDLRDVLATGQSLTDVELTGRSVMPPHRRMAMSASAFRLEDERGNVLGLAVSVVDVTERYRARRHLELLERAAARLSLSLDVLDIAGKLADLTVPEFADVAVVDVMDSVLRGEAPGPGDVVEELPLRRAACHALPGAAGFDAEQVGEMTGFPFGTPYSESLADLRPRLVGDLRAAEGWLTADVLARAGVAGTGAHSLLVIPLTARDVVMGLVAFYRTSTPTPFDEQDLALGVDLGAHAAVCLDNARLYKLRQAAARLLQLTLRPARVGAHLAVETARSYRPIGSGGDWFDVIALSGERVALVAGDTGGQGVRAVATMAELRATVSALATMDLPPGEVLARLHIMVTRLAEERAHVQRDFGLDPPPGQGRGSQRPARTTCLYAVYDPLSGTCQLANAGHPSPAIAYPDGTFSLAPVIDGPPLGVSAARHETVTMKLPAGTVLALCNAGLLRDPDENDSEPRSERLLRALAQDGVTLQDRCDAVFRALTPHRPRGDAVLLLARTHALGPDRAASWSWPHDPAIVAQARDAVRRQLVEWGLEDLVESMVLVVSELATNAIRYAHSSIGVRLIRGEQSLTCEVSDDSTAAPWLRRAEEDDESGRGMLITTQLTSRWGVRQSADGKIIWVEQHLPAT